MADKYQCWFNGFVKESNTKYLSMIDAVEIEKSFLFGNRLFQIGIAFRIDKKMEIDAYIFKGWFFKNRLKVGEWLISI